MKNKNGKKNNPIWGNKTNHCVVCGVVLPINRKLCIKCGKKQIHQRFRKNAFNSDIKYRKFIPVTPMKKIKIEIAEYVFTPDKELIAFANEFSKMYKKVRVGEYCSSNNKYHIKYLARIKNKNTGKALATGARISNMTGIIELDKFIYKSKEYTPDFLFFIIIWCVVCRENKGNMKLSDKNAIKYYKTTKRSKRNIMKGFLKLFFTVPSLLNTERYKIIAQLLK